MGKTFERSGKLKLANGKRGKAPRRRGRRPHFHWVKNLAARQRRERKKQIERKRSWR